LRVRVAEISDLLVPKLAPWMVTVTGPGATTLVRGEG
jgi:hypothetical protein